MRVELARPPPASTRRMPGASAIEVGAAREGRRDGSAPRRRIGRQRARRSGAAASSSGTSPGSSRATVTVADPGLAPAPRHRRPDSVRPFFSRPSGRPTECARIAPSASAMPGPARTSSAHASRGLAHGLRPGGSPAGAAARSSRPGSRWRSRPASARRCRGRSGASMRAISSSRQPRLLQPLDALGMGPRRAERADVEDGRAQRRQQRRVVELGVVGQRHDRRAGVEPVRRQRRVRPVVHQLLRRETAPRWRRPRAGRSASRHSPSAAPSRPAAGRCAPRRRRPAAAAGCGRQRNRAVAVLARSRSGRRRSACGRSA